MSATISQCGLYRYNLTRMIAPDGHKACVIMVNPSTAGHTENDATIRKVTGFGKIAGWSEFTVVNKFAYRATDVNDLKRVADPVGPLNDGYILSALMQADVVMVAWGSLGKLPPHLRGRWRQIVALIEACNKSPLCLGLCSDGHPKHPLMPGYSTALREWKI